MIIQVKKQKLTKKKASEITIAKRVDKQAVENLATQSVDGVYYSRDNLRSYPYGDTLCQVLGFTSSDNVGTTGLEKYYLSATACEGIIRRAEKRGKELPPLLKEALMQMIEREQSRP